ncbi:MAG: hypothetical protein CSA68_06225 [Rhodobacterales bacterium]|nr:MAG: hypothetical protein CSA68_06225 [Rhodobacterales bacterium]
MNRKTGKNRAALPLWQVDSGQPAPAGGCIALIHGEDAPLLSVDLPKGIKGVNRDRVARGQLLSQLGTAEKTIELRPFLGAGKRSGWDKMLVADQALYQRWQELGQPDNITAVLPDYLALPAAPALWVMRQDQGRIIARLGPEDGFACEAALAAPMLDRALASAPPKAALWLEGSPPDAMQTLLNQHDIPLIEDQSTLAAHGIDSPQRFAHNELALDLSRDPYAALADLRQNLRPWKWVAALAALGVCFWSASLLIDINRLQAQSNQHRLNANQIVRQHFIPTGPILDIRSQVGRLMAQQQAQQSQQAVFDPLDAFRQAAAVALKQGAVLARVAHRENTGLLLDVQLTDFAGLDQLVAALRQGGLTVTLVQSNTRENGGVEATLSLTGNG